MGGSKFYWAEGKPQFLTILSEEQSYKVKILLVRNGFTSSDFDNMPVGEIGKICEYLNDIEFIKEYKEYYKHLTVVSTIINVNVKKKDRIEVNSIIDSEYKKRYEEIINKDNPDAVSHEEKLEFMKDSI